MVSPVDKRYLDRVNGRPERNHVLRNGVAAESRAAVARAPEDPYRLIFTGSMAFPPNARGALWFIEKVMPLLLKRRQDIRFVVAGQDPGPELLAKASQYVEITGPVPDITAEIAHSQLYVAPLFSGAGFRNKVVEALISGAYVIGTPMALECFEDRLRDSLLTASSAREFAEKVLEFLVKIQSPMRNAGGKRSESSRRNTRGPFAPGSWKLFQRHSYNQHRCRDVKLTAADRVHCQRADVRLRRALTNKAREG